MLSIQRKCFERVAVFTDDRFVGWVSVEFKSGRSRRAKVGFGDWPDEYRLVREELLSPEQKRLTEARHSA